LQKYWVWRALAPKVLEISWGEKPERNEAKCKESKGKAKKGWRLQVAATLG